MIEKVKRWLSGQSPQADSESADALPPHAIAAAVLMVEAAHLDDHFGEPERAAIHEILKRHFGLDDEAAKDLLDEAEAKQEDAVELYSFTRRIKDEMTPEARVEIIEMLWEVAYADGVLNKYEEQLVRRVAGLIYVTDRERGEARKRVLERLGLTE